MEFTKYTQYIAVIIKWFIYFLSEGNKLVDAQVGYLKTRLITCDQVILDEKLKYWVIEEPLYNLTADWQ